MALPPIDVKLQYMIGLASTPSEDAWRDIESWSNITWVDSEDITENTLRIQMLVPDGEEGSFEGIVSMRLTLEQEGAPIIQERFQIKGTGFNEIENLEPEEVATHGTINCNSLVGKDAAIEFLRKTFPAQVYDYWTRGGSREGTLPDVLLGAQAFIEEHQNDEAEPQLGVLLDTEDTIGSIRRQPIRADTNHAHTIAFILSHGIPRLLAYDDPKDNPSMGIVNDASGLQLRKDANAGHLVASLIGDILWEHDDWPNLKKLLDSFGFGIHFIDLSPDELNRKFGQQKFDDEDFVANNPKILQQLQNADAKVGDNKYLTPEDSERFAKQPVPILINPYTYSTLENADIPPLKYLTRSFSTPDVTQLHNAGRVSFADEPIRPTSGFFDPNIRPLQPQKFWETFIGSTKIVGRLRDSSDDDEDFVLEGPQWKEGNPDPDKVPEEVPDELKPFLIGYNPDDGLSQPVTAEMRELGFYTFERRVDGVTRSPYVPASFPNVPAREIAITVAQARRRVRSKAYTFTLEPVIGFRAGSRHFLDRPPEQGAVMRINKVTHNFNASGTSSMTAEAYRLNS